MDIPVPTDGSRKAHHGPSRLEAAMEKYNKMSAEAQKRAELNKPKARAAPPPRVRASLAKLTLKERVVLTAVRGRVQWAPAGGPFLAPVARLVPST
jgi:hypothetical protein